MKKREAAEARLSVSLDSGLEGNGVGADDLADLLAVLVEEEGGHGAHALLLGDFGDLVDVDLVEAGVGVVVGEPVVEELVSVSACCMVCACVCFCVVALCSWFVLGGWLICNPAGLLRQAWERMGRNSLDDLRSDDLAGTAPGGEEVNDHEALLAESGVEVGLAVNHVQSVFRLFRAQGWSANAGARAQVSSRLTW